MLAYFGVISGLLYDENNGSVYGRFGLSSDGEQINCGVEELVKGRTLRPHEETEKECAVKESRHE